MSGRRRWFMLVAAGLLVAVLAVLFARARSTPTVAVESGEIEQRLPARATVLPSGGIAHVRAATGGTVREVRARVGDVVEAGAVLATIAIEGAAGEAPRAGSVTAPIAGTVLARLVGPGDTIPAPGGAILFEIADLKRIEARIEVEESAASSLAVGRAVELRRRGGGAIVAKGTIDRVGPIFERRQIGATDARVRGDGPVRPAWAALASDGALVVGEELEAVILLPTRHVAARVPRGAVLIDDGQAFVEVPGAVFARRVKVTLGASDARFVEVTGIEIAARVNVR